MFEFLFKKEEKGYDYNKIWADLKKYYKFETADKNKADKISALIEKFGYLPYPQFQALEELTPALTLYAFEKKLEYAGVFKGGKFISETPSPLVRENKDNADWIRQEGRDIKLINLAALGDGNKGEEPGKFIDWLKQVLILPSAPLSTIIYLIPFHPREFGCAYLPKSSRVSENLEDKELSEKTGINLEDQVKIFIRLAQFASHPVIYDVLPQSGRFSKMVLSNPQIARWYNINELIIKLINASDLVAQKLKDEFSIDDIEIVNNILKKSFRGASCDLSEFYNNILSRFEEKITPLKKQLCEEMALAKNQEQIVKEVRQIVKKVNEEGAKRESHIKKHNAVICELIKEGYWSLPGGAWCSLGLPVFDKMSECESFPLYTHFDKDANDVTHFANLDCQTPYYFAYLENGKLNNEVVDFFIKHLKWLQKEYNFDGFRYDHVDHVVDAISQTDSKPISYRIPAQVLKQANDALKDQVPYFAAMAEYMLWDCFYKEYNQDMNFDALWGNDIICQADKTPERIVEDNNFLAQYNEKNNSKLTILKTYNNQDGEFAAIDQYPGQLGFDGALFKWFKYKFLPGGKSAQRPVLYVDGDESFTLNGVERVIGCEVSMIRSKNKEFFNKFSAIDRFCANSQIIKNGEAKIITQDEDGFSTWIINADPLKEAILVAANYLPNTEKVNMEMQDGSKSVVIKEGTAVHDKLVELPSDYKIICEYILKDEPYADFIEQPSNNSMDKLFFEKLEPSEFRVFKISR